MATVLFFDPYPIVGLGFAQILKSNRSHLATRTVSSLDGLALLAKDLTPDLLVLTINTPKDKNPLPVLEQCRKIYPETPVVMYDEGHFYSHIEKWLQSGVSGYLLKSESEALLLQCIDTVLNGGKFLSPGAFGQFLQPVATIVRPANTKLGRQESRVAWFLAFGKSTTWIARQMERNPSTISTMKKRIFTKFQVTNVIDLRSILDTVRHPTEVPSTLTLNSSNLVQTALAAI